MIYEYIDTWSNVLNVCSHMHVYEHEHVYILQPQARYDRICACVHMCLQILRIHVYMDVYTYLNIYVFICIYPYVSLPSQ